MEKIKRYYFDLQVNEATDLHRDAHLIALVKFIDGEEIREDILFCEPFLTNTTCESIFYIIVSFLRTIICSGKNV